MKSPTECSDPPTAAGRNEGEALGPTTEKPIFYVRGAGRGSCNRIAPYRPRPLHWARMQHVTELLEELHRLCEAKSSLVFYHAGPKGLRPGTTLRPDPVARTSEIHEFVEELFEEARKRVAPNAPSRKGAIYVVNSPDRAGIWKPHDGTVYEVKLAPGGKVHETDPEMYTEAVMGFGWRPRPNGFTSQDREHVLSYARAYWIPDDEMADLRMWSPQEILIQGRVTIVRDLEEAPVMAKKPSRKKRCPKGTRRNPKTGRCVKTGGA